MTKTGNIVQEHIDHEKQESRKKDPVWTWPQTVKDLKAMHVDPFYTISITSGLQMRKSYNFNHTIDYLAVSTCYAGETFIAVQNLTTKSLLHILNTIQNKNCKVKLQFRINCFLIINSLSVGVALCGDNCLRVFTSVPSIVEVGLFILKFPATIPVFNPFTNDVLIGSVGKVHVWSFIELKLGMSYTKKPSLHEGLRLDLIPGEGFVPYTGHEWVTCMRVDKVSAQVLLTT